MFWDKKEEKRLLPDLPPLRMPELPNSMQSENIDLPDIPYHSDDMPSHEMDDFPEPSRSIHSMPETRSTIRTIAIKEEFPAPEEYIPSTPSIIQQPESKSSIFIKLDKFQSAKKSLILLEQKVNEIESMLRKIRETRLREEQELAAWEKEVSMVKPRIEDISKNLFDKI